MIKEVSIIGTSYIQPIIDLYKILNNKHFVRTSQIRVSSNENSYSCAIIALSVFCIESFITRIRYLNKENLTKRAGALEYFNDTFGNQKDLKNKLIALFIIRDIIVHNSLWEISYDLGNDFNEVNITKKLLSWTDKKFYQNIDLTKEQTTILNLNIIPTKLGKEDVKKVLEVLNDFLDFISNQKKGYCNYAMYSELKEILDNQNVK